MFTMPSKQQSYRKIRVSFPMHALSRFRFRRCRNRKSVKKKVKKIKPNQTKKKKAKVKIVQIANTRRWLFRRETGGPERLVREAGERVRGAPNAVRVRCQQLRIGGGGGA